MGKNEKKDNKLAEKAVDKYLREPSDESIKALGQLEYIPALIKRVEKLGNKVLKPALELLADDKSEAATEYIGRIAADAVRPVWARLEAFELLKKRKAAFDKELRESLIEIDRIASKDDAKAAGELYPTLGADLQGAFAEAVIEHKAAKALEGASQAATDPAAIKVLRRAAHALSSMGEKVGEIQRKDEAVFKPAEKQEPMAFVSYIDSAGQRIVYLVLPGLMGGVNVFQGIIDEKEGLAKFDAIETNRRGLGIFLKRTKDDRLTAVEPVYISWLLDKAAAKAQGQAPLPPDYLQHRSMLPEIPAGYKPSDPRDKMSPAPSISDARDAFDKLGEAGTYPWLPDMDSLRSARLRLDEILQSKVIINEEQRKEQIEKTFDDAAAKYLEGDMAELLAERLEGAAYLLTLDNKPDAARAAIAVADEIRAYSGADIKSLRLLPKFVVEMFRKSFPDIHEHRHDHDHENCQNPEHDHGHQHEKKSKGGIIMP